MAGDVNLFFNDDDDASVCEIEVMIAEPAYRRQGFAKEAIKILMAYGACP
jgi:RimJ/RimL family protein N-acetyltransferase